MTQTIEVPSLPESIADASVAAWHKKVGEQVSEGEILLELETDKVMLEVPAMSSGVLTSIDKDIGSIVVSGEALGVIDAEAKASAQATQTVDSDDKSEKQGSQKSALDVPVSPSLRRELQAHDIDIASVQGTGKDGRIVKEDVKAAMASQSSMSAPVSQSAVVSEQVPTAREEKRVPMSRLRAKVAERLLQAQQQAAILTTFNEVNMKPVMDLRRLYQDDFVKKFDVKLGFMSFFVKAAVHALKMFPEVNASIDGSDVMYHGYFDMGIAVSSPRGLVVPVVRDADQLGMADIEKTIKTYAVQAKDGKLALEDMMGGTFTITNGGVFGSMLSTPILNPPQSAILGMHNIVERVVVENGEMVIRPMMYLALSYDHRLIDGQQSVRFLVTIKEMLEDPSRFLLDV
jgi:2-oxoglutarate dehydrogenase E2 component (dihydrolipoamide succinyltransferase)